MVPRLTNLGYPRIGPNRELKTALEAYWRGDLSEATLLDTAKALRRDAWETQVSYGLDQVPCGDFSLYDHVADTAVALGAVPERYLEPDGSVSLASYFAMARGKALPDGSSVPALEMTKWFDTNYHYLVPEIHRGQRFDGRPTKLLAEFAEARALGHNARPLLVGPLTFALLSKLSGLEPAQLLEQLAPAYARLISHLADAGADWFQLDEPALVLDLDSELLQATEACYAQISEAVAGRTSIFLATYYGGLGQAMDTCLKLPVQAVHLDLVSDPGQLEPALQAAPEGMALSLGVVNGRNVWRSDLDSCLSVIRTATNKLGRERVIIAPSCPLFHLPYDSSRERGLAPELRDGLCFAIQRLEEISLLRRASDYEGLTADDSPSSSADSAIAAQWEETRRIRARWLSWRASGNPDLEQRLAAMDRGGTRTTTAKDRRPAQLARLGLGLLPVTTVGSFPQTTELRRLRRQLRNGQIDQSAYDSAIRQEVARVISFQEEIGIDVLVHGEPERNDMVEFFAEMLDGFALTEHGWVQSYGSRCVRPPLLYGDVERTRPMTVDLAKFAQSLSTRPVKGILTGPVTMAAWCFVREDQSLEATCRQLALAVREEVEDLERAGISVIQIDEPALRELLPLRVAERPRYLHWAVQVFRLACGSVRDDTQIQTHMCYGEFDDIIDAIVAMDPDVILVEASRSGMEPIAIFGKASFGGGVGPGLYDVHSPLVPSVAQMEEALHRAVETLPAEQIWVVPDCGLKTRTWEEVRPSLANMVEAARRVRKWLSEKGPGEASG